MHELKVAAGGDSRYARSVSGSNLCHAGESTVELSHLTCDVVNVSLSSIRRNEDRTSPPSKPVMLV